MEFGGLLRGKHCASETGAHFVSFFLAQIVRKLRSATTPKGVTGLDQTAGLVISRGRGTDSFGDRDTRRAQYESGVLAKEVGRRVSAMQNR